jgi:hypothetical protein
MPAQVVPGHCASGLINMDFFTDFADIEEGGLACAEDGKYLQPVLLCWTGFSFHAAVLFLPLKWNLSFFGALL